MNTSVPLAARSARRGAPVRHLATRSRAENAPPTGPRSSAASACRLSPAESHPHASPATAGTPVPVQRHRHSWPRPGSPRVPTTPLRPCGRPAASAPPPGLVCGVDPRPIDHPDHAVRARHSDPMRWTRSSSRQRMRSRKPVMSVRSARGVREPDSRRCRSACPTSTSRSIDASNSASGSDDRCDRAMSLNACRARRTRRSRRPRSIAPDQTTRQAARPADQPLPRHQRAAQQAHAEQRCEQGGADRDERSQTAARGRASVAALPTAGACGAERPVGCVEVGVEEERRLVHQWRSVFRPGPR